MREFGALRRTTTDPHVSSTGIEIGPNSSQQPMQTAHDVVVARNGRGRLLSAGQEGWSRHKGPRSGPAERASDRPASGDELRDRDDHFLSLSAMVRR